MTRDMIIAYRYEDSVHCLSCARRRFGKRLNLPNILDKEGGPVEPIFSGKEWQGIFCNDCAEPLMEKDG